MIRIYILLILLATGGRVQTQTMYGTTGLLYAPTVDMQYDKNVHDWRQRATPYSITQFQQQRILAQDDKWVEPDDGI